MNIVDSNIVALAHDAMADEYDTIQDFWYTHLFKEIHAFILKSLKNSSDLTDRSVLDIGCGTGLQSFLYAEAGFNVLGIDLSEKLINKAKSKLSGFSYGNSDFSKDMINFHKEAQEFRGTRPRGNIEFIVGNAMDMKWYNKKYDFINCCGSVLSFVNNPEVVLQHLSNAMNSGSKLILETEMRYNLDLIWPLFDFMLFGNLGYEQSINDSLKNLLTPLHKNIQSVYPFPLENGKIVNLPMHLFSHMYLNRKFMQNNLIVLKNQSIHSISNMIPSTLYHDNKIIPKKILKFLTHLDSIIGKYKPFSLLGCSSLFELVKR